MWRSARADTGRDRHQHAGQADLARRSPCGDRVHAGREDGLRPRQSPQCHPPRDRHQHSGQAGQDRRTPLAIAITPDGKTAYIIAISRKGVGKLIPVATATNTPGRPVKIAGTPLAIAITPDGRTAYVVSLNEGKSSGSVIPVATATNTPGRPISISGGQSHRDHDHAGREDRLHHRQSRQCHTGRDRHQHAGQADHVSATP